MKLSAKAEYVTRAMLEIALGQAQGPVGIRHIAERQSIPIKYLESLMPALKKAGLLKSVRGARGGYLLARPASQIGLAEILSAVEGGFAPFDCADGPADCAMDAACAIQEVWCRIEALLSAELAAVSLAALAERQQAMLDQRVIDFQI